MTKSEIEKLRDDLHAIEGMSLYQPKEICKAIWLLADVLDRVLQDLK